MEWRASGAIFCQRSYSILYGVVGKIQYCRMTTQSCALYNILIHQEAAKNRLEEEEILRAPRGLLRQLAKISSRICCKAPLKGYLMILYFVKETSLLAVSHS